MKPLPNKWLRNAKGSDIRKAGGYRAYINKMKNFKLSADKVDRNSKCPCASGKKYKKCCINK